MGLTSRGGVFISYARSDGDGIARELRSRLEAEGLPLWRDHEGLEGGRDWWLQIAEALDTSEFMVLVMTPAAMASELVRKEWRYARQRGVCVYPVMGMRNLPFEELPRWMHSAHFYDLEHEWPKFLNDLRTSCQAPRVPFMAEELPAEFVPRPSEFERLVSHVLDRERDEPIAITTALRAAGGYGKTVLARALCHDEHIQNAFDDGILWVTLGENPGDLTKRVEDLIYLLSGKRPGFAGIEAATALFVELLADRDLLIVIDDVWDATHLRPFTQGGPRCARVITTRTLDALPVGTHRVDVDAMQQNEAVALVGYGLPEGSDAALAALAARLCEWPLLLKLANAALRDRLHTGQSVPDALDYVNRALKKRGLTFFDARDPIARHQAVAKTIDLSLERLNANELERFVELAVFPEDVNIPLTTLGRLWQRTGGLDDFDTEYLCERLYRLSLTLAFDPALRVVKVHDVIRQYLTGRIGDRLPKLHRELLEAHRPESAAWADLPPKDPYMWDHLATHLKAADSGTELVATVLDLRYIAAKTFARNALATERDLRVAELEEPDDNRLKLLRRSFVQSSHIFNRCRSLADLEATLHTRLQHLEPLAPMAAHLVEKRRAPRLAAAHPLPDLPHPALIRTLTESIVTIWGCAISADGSFIVSTAYDGMPTIWDARSATERFKLIGHKSWAPRCAISRDCTFIVTASYDRRVGVWDAATGELRTFLVGHTDAVTDCAVSPDGTFIVSTSLDGSVRIWDARTGAHRRSLASDWGVWGCAVSPDGTLIASASSDQTVKLWNAESGDELRTFHGHEAMVTSCAFSPDGSLLASSSADATIRVWDRASGAARFELISHLGPVNRCVFTADGRGLVSGSSDRTVKIWDIKSGERTTFYGHTDVVNDCAVAPGGSYVVSASLDGTLKLWDTTAGLIGFRSAPHRDWVNDCAFNPDGTLVATASSDMRVKVWDPKTGVSLRTFTGHENSVRGCAFSPDGHTVVSASADKSLARWDVATGYRTARALGHTDWVNCCCFSPNNELVLSASSDKTLRLWDALTLAKRLSIVAHRDSVNSCAFSANGRFFVSASTDARVKIWDVRRVLDYWESYPSPEWRRTANEWEDALGPLVLESHDRGVNYCAIARDDSFIVSASSDKTLKIWDATTGVLIRTLAGHRDDVNGCAIAPDGSRIVSASQDKTLKMWDVATGECLTTLHVDGALGGCAWSPTGEHIVAAGAGGVYFLVMSPAGAPVVSGL